MMLRRYANMTFTAIAYVVVVFAAWEAVIWLFDVKAFLLPSPRAVLRSYANLPSYYARHAYVTFTEAGLGVLIGFAAGFLLGIVIRYSGPVGRVLQPFILASQVFPKEALAPLFIVFLGFGVAPKILISALICFFPVVVNTAQGLQATPPGFERLMHVMGASPWERFWHCQLPFASRYILASLRMCATLSVIGAVVGEFVGASAGLGHVIRAANADIGTERIYAALLLLGLMGAAFYGTAAFVERVLFRRYARIA